MSQQNFVDRLESRGHAAGTMVFEFFSSGMPAIAKNAGADFVLYDMEHSGVGFETLKQQTAACRGLDIAPLIRVPSHAYDHIARALDIGAHGVMAPMVESAEQARAIAAATQYPPAGVRGAAFGMAHDDYRGGAPVDKIAALNHRSFVIALVETVTGVENVENIAATDGVDVIWLGHFDLTNSMGIPGQFDHPDYLAAVERIVRAARAANKPLGFMAADNAWARQYWDFGFRIMAFGVDHMLFQSALTSGIDVIRGFMAKGGDQ